MIKYIGIVLIVIALFNMWFVTDVMLDSKSVAAVSLASAVVYNNGRDNVVPPRPPAPTGHKREDCPTGGWVTHGDSHKTRCPDCVPAWESTTKKYKLTLQDKHLSWKTPNGKCCPDCKCETCKYCMYPGECLVKANNGKDVIIYDESCDDDNGTCSRVPVRKYSKGKPMYEYPKQTINYTPKKTYYHRFWR